MTDASWPALAAVFWVYFDDIKGQTLGCWLSELNPLSIEHAALPSGVHGVDEDAVMFEHAGKAAVGLFRGRDAEGTRRGRRMGTLGVVLATGDAAALFDVVPLLRGLFDAVESDEMYGDVEAPELMRAVWERAKGEATASDLQSVVYGKPPGALHPVAYMPALLGLLGPLMVPVYKAALSGRRVLLYSPPPLLPIGAFAWCVVAASLGPTVDGDTPIEPARWLGNVGLMDLDSVRGLSEGWVATTSDAIYRSHAVYDLFVDLSTSPPTLSAPNARGVTYALADLALYRSLVGTPEALAVAQPARRSVYSGTGGWWLLAFDAFDRVYSFCAGVCAFAVGQGVVRLEQDSGSDDGGEEREGLLGDLEDWEGEESPGDPAVLEGRAILRQLWHHTFHLHLDLVRARGSEGVRREDARGGWAGALSGARAKEEERAFWERVGRKWA